MPGGLSELFAMIQDEFGVDIEDPRDAAQTTPSELIAYVLDSAPEVGGPMSDAERRQYVEEVLGELMEQALGVTRYDEESTFAEILRSARGH